MLYFRNLTYLIVQKAEHGFRQFRIFATTLPQPIGIRLEGSPWGVYLSL